ncbi:hybrid PKS-NRPS [Lentithecium fluviatile CBS 122367]|uniref:Hybrid PKS-NRPS n=1 Tax=Lentithecium fluviatile CBS 122367 TaxID=1168545 RepID=A0A6G1J720_9PLEO|nr:hybrid PKS-NRPS [Lentithecium fluviatile CBS 122367]
MKEPIAVVGSSCRFPGGANSPSKLWTLLKDPRDVLTEFPEHRLNLKAFYNTNGEHHGRTDVKNKSYLLAEDHRLFDAAFFNISPLEAEGMDPQQRVMLETVYEALEAAGYTLKQMQGSPTAVFIGNMTADWHDIQSRDTEVMPRYNATATARSILSNRISYFFDLRGPSLTIDTACSSSLVAVHQAVQSLRSGETRTAIVGGATLLLDPAMYVAESKLHMLSPDSRSRMWDSQADGYARGEGFSAVILKPLSQAVTDGDHVESIIRETGVNSDGRTKGITMPSATAQTSLIRQVYHSAGLDPLVDRPQFFECHGTGTSAGDPVEAQAIHEAFFSNEEKVSEDMDKLYVGSIKTIIGHLEGCAGLAGLLKASLALKNRTIPPNMHFNELNPKIKPFYKHVKVPTSARPWPEVRGAPLRASVNSFGFGGTNAHAIIENPEFHLQSHSSNIDVSVSTSKDQDRFFGPLVFSANTQDSLLRAVKEHVNYIRSNPSLDLSDLSWVLQNKRSALPIKTFFSGATREDLLQFMDKAADAASAAPSGEIGTRAHVSNSSELPGVLAIFTGQGAQWASMGQSLIRNCRLFRESIGRCEAALTMLPDSPSWSLKEEIMADESASRLSDAAFSQPLCTALQVAMVDLCHAAGIKFDAVVGHSSGEIAAIYAAGIISANDAIRIAYYRGFHSKLARGTNGKRGAMMAVGLSFENALVFCSEPAFRGRIQVAASNGPSSVTLSGDVDAIEEAKQIFDQEKTFARQLKVDTAYHSHHMLPCSRPYLDSLIACDIQVQSPKDGCVWISSVRGDAELLEGNLASLNGQYWVDNMIQPVLFTQALECSLWNGGPFDMVVELGPHPALKGPAVQTFKSVLGSTLPYAGFMRRETDEFEAFSGGVGYLWSYLGPSHVDFDGYRKAFVESDASAPKMISDLPSYSWSHEKIMWKESRISRNYRLRDQTPHELLGRRVPDDADYEMRWRNILRLNELPWLEGHRFQDQCLFPGAGYIAMALEASKVVAGDNPVRLIEIQDMFVRRALTIDEDDGVETIFTVKRAEMENGSIRAEFACYVCTDEATGSLERTCDGFLALHLGHSITEELPSKGPIRSNLSPVDTERFYGALYNLGLDYQGLFRGNSTTKRKLEYATVTTKWEDTSIGQHYLLHPSIIDVSFHSVFAALASSESDVFWTPYLPVHIDRFMVNPNVEFRTDAGELVTDVETFLTKATVPLIEGDIHMFDSHGQTGVQIEGLRLKSFTEPKESNDRLLFSHTVWGNDIFGGVSALQEEPNNDELELNDAIERTALYFFQAVFRQFAPEEVYRLESHFQQMYETFMGDIELIRQGQHPVAKKEWMVDKLEDIVALRERFPGRVDLELMHRIGENLADVLRGETQLLEVMMQENTLNRFYMEGRLFVPINKCISEVAKMITHKFPRMKILEIGAGTGGTTRQVLDVIGQSYSTYTYTDISSGFFEKSAEKFKDHRSKFVFKTLNIEKDVSEQGYGENGYDLIIAANVLHATRNLTETMQHTRSLLKPGGYLLLMEVTGDTLALPFVMGGLPGWWLGVKEGRVRGPGISPVQWDDLLRRTGFSGVEKLVHDLPDPAKHSCSMIVSQAVDERLEILRDPLSFIDSVALEDRLLILGGTTLAASQLVNGLKKVLARRFEQITVAKTIDLLDDRVLTSQTAVISLTEVDRPLFSDMMTSARLDKLQNLFSKTTDMLWVTSGRLCDSPESNMLLGIGRAFQFELPNINLQFIDVDKSIVDANVLSESFLRLSASKRPDFSDKQILWSRELEVVLDKSGLLIPRIKLDKDANHTFNSMRRTIMTEVKPTETAVELVRSEGSLVLQARRPIEDPASSSRTSIQVEYSVAIPANDGVPVFLCFGRVERGDQKVLAMSDFNSSIACVEPNAVFVLPKQEVLTASAVRAVADQLIADALLSTFPANGSTVIYEPSKTLATTIVNSAGWSTRKYVFAGAKQRDMSNWVTIHSKASRRDVRGRLPRDLTCFIDMSHSKHSRIQSCLPLNCARRTFQFPVLEMGDICACVSKAYTEATNCSGPGFKEEVTAIPIQELSGACQGTEAYPAVISWQQAKSLAVPIKPADSNKLFSTKKTYFLIGMTSALGLSICAWMVRSGARYLALASRSAHVDPLWLTEMQELGANIQVYKMDISDMASLRSAYETICKTMPPIAGVANAAMVLHDKLFIDMEADVMNDTLKPKVDGTKYLDDIFSRNNLDFFILFSSLGSVVGNGGQSNYHAANLFMSSLASRRRRKGLAASVINIGMVVDVGYIARTGQALIDRLKKSCYAPLTETDIHHLFAEAILASSPNSVRESDIIMGLTPIVDSVSGMNRPPWYGNPRFSHFLLDEEVSEKQPQTSSNALHIRQKLEACNSEEAAAEAILEAFSSKLETMLQLPPKTVTVDVPILDIGADSLLAVEIRTWFLNEVHVDIPVLKVLSGDTVTEICGDAARKYLSSTTNHILKPAVLESPKEESHRGSSSVSGSVSGASSSDALLPSAKEALTPITSFSTDDRDPILGSLAKLNEVARSTSFEPISSLPRLFERTEKMTYGQSRIWFLQEYLKDLTAHNLTCLFEVTGALQVPRFKRALSTVVARHESFRTCFFTASETSKFMQGVHFSPPQNYFKHVYSTEDMQVQRELQNLKTRRWNLEGGQTLQVTLMTHAPDRHTIIFGYHHIILDGVSWGLFLRELNAAYQSLPLKPVAKHNFEFAVEEANAVEKGTFDDQLEFWKTEFTTLPEAMPLLPFALVKSRPLHQLSKDHTVVVEIGSDVVGKVKTACRNLRATPFHFHLAIMQVILYRMLDIADICIGVTDANRKNESFNNTVGFLLNILALRFRVTPDDEFADLVKRTSKKVLSATDNGSVPFDVVLDKLNVPRASTNTPLFQVAFNYRMGDMVDFMLGDCQMKLTDAQEAKNPFDLVFNITQSSTSCFLQISGNEYLYSPQASELLAHIYVTLLTSLSVNSSTLVKDCALFSTEASKDALILGTGPLVDFHWPATLTERFETTCRENPDTVAVKDVDGEISYSELARKAEQIAAALVEQGVPPGSTVAVLSEPSTETVASMLAIMMHECIYMPLDLSVPPARQSAMVQNGQPYAILCQSSTSKTAEMLATYCASPKVLNISGQLPSHPTPVRKAIRKDLPTFLLYTSGSTGSPKGMILRQAGFINYLASKGTRLSLRKEVVLQQSSLGFDMSIAQMFNALANGGTIVMVPQSARGDPVEISRLMLKEKVSFTIATPTEYLAWIRYGPDHLRQYNQWRIACSGGEAVTEQLKRAFSSLNQNMPTVTDCYGPTEISAATSFETVALTSCDEPTSHEQPTVGKAIPNTSIYIVHEDGNSVPAGFPGEICIGGVGVALGYLHSQDPKQVNKFAPNPFASTEYIEKGWKTMYKTGDKGLLTPNGSLVFIGRLDGDRQIKLRGLRIDLDDIANNLLQVGQGLITDAAVSVRGNPQYLIAHVVPVAGQDSSRTQLRQLSNKLTLPQYMHPAIIAAVDRLPMNPNGKIDWKTIDSLELPSQGTEAWQYDGFSLAEGEIKLIWESVLRCIGNVKNVNISPDSDFFALGGNSLLLIRLQGAIKEATGVQIALLDLYQTSTVRAMAAMVATRKGQQPPEEPIDWEAETAVPEELLALLAKLPATTAPRNLPRKSSNLEILLTGSTSFLGSAVLTALLHSTSVSRVHCVAVPSEDRGNLPESGKVVVYTGSLYNTTLGLSYNDCSRLQASVDIIVHAGANGHCLNGFSSLRAPNLHATRFLADLAVRAAAASDAKGSVRLHFLSSNRVTLLSGNTAMPPASLAQYSPATDGTEGFTAAKWASERFLEKSVNTIRQQSRLEVVIHRPCAVVGDSAPSEDALNALVRYSRLMRAVPKFGENVQGFFDFKDVHAVAAEIVAEVVPGDHNAFVDRLESTIQYRHHTSGVEVPVKRAREHMEKMEGSSFNELDMSDWLARARQLGIEALIVSYLDAVSGKDGLIRFPYMGKLG